MARTQLQESVFEPQGRLLVHVDGASVAVNYRGDGAAPVYAASTGTTQITQPLTTTYGRLSAPTDPAAELWLEPGAYDLVVTAAGGRTWKQRFEVRPADVSLLDYWNASHADYNTAFTNAYADLDPAVGGVLQLPPNRLMDVSANITPPSNTTVIGPRTAVVRAKAGSNVAVFRVTDKTGVHLRGFTVDGNQANVPGGNGIIIEGTTDFSVVDVAVRNAWNNGILIDYTTQASKSGRISGCKVSGSGSAAAFAVSGGHGIALSGNSGVADSGPWHVVVSDNILEENYSSGVNVSQAQYCTVSGNSITKAATNSTGYAGVRCSNGTRGTSITGNTILNHSRGVYITANAASGASERNVVSGNYIEGAYFQGILVGASWTVVSGNDIYNCCVGTPDGAIRLAAVGSPQTDVKGCAVTGNTIIDTNGSPNHAYGIRSLDDAPGVCDYNSFTGNVIFGFQTDSMSVPGIHNRVAGNSTNQTADRPSAATLIVRDDQDNVNVTGETTITALDSPSRRQDRKITLQFNTNIGCILQAGSSLRLAGGANFSATKYDAITLAYQATGDYWYEVSRSVNA
jgi:hypothetical protein